ncbi:YbaY family lipoprotein [Marinobacter halodurans]|nr:YbaY family lipoprotein [Marinobacter halodurans]
MMQGKRACGGTWRGIALAALALVTAGAMSGCAPMMERFQASKTRQIEGTVTYRERMMLPPDAQVTVALEDVSLADAPAEPVADMQFRAEGAPPWSFTLSYEPDQVIEGRHYNLRAKVTLDDRLLFMSTEAHPVELPGDTGPVAILVSRASGTIAEMARADSARNSLIGTFWELTRIHDDPISQETDQRKLNMVLSEEGQRISGFSGCNQFAGHYTLNGDQLQFGPLASTMIACFKGMEQEDAYQKALRAVTHYRIQGPLLQLLDKDNEVVLQFVSGDQL